MFRTLINAFKNKDVRKKILITFGILFLYRIGCWLPVPGINFSEIEGATAANSLLQLLASITGGALSQGAFFAIGISPYINSSIIMQLLTVAIPKLERLSKQGEEGKKKIQAISRVLTVVLAIAQATGIVLNWNNQGGIQTGFFGFDLAPWVMGMFIGIMLVGGSMLTMWIGERITEVGIGNGISLLIFVGILSSAGLGIIAMFTNMASGDQTAIWVLLLFLLIVVLIFFFIAYVDLAERKIPIQYAKQVKGRKMYGGQSTFIPMKVSAAGVMPIIFASAIITFPQMIASFWPDSPFFDGYQKWVGVNGYIYPLLIAILIFFFSYFYAQIQFNPEEVSRNIQQYGGFIPGIRPGKPTYEYLVRISKRITFFGALYLTIIAVIPSMIFTYVPLFQANQAYQMLVNSMAATGMLIVVSVALEFEKQLESLIMMKQYKGFLK